MSAFLEIVATAFLLQLMALPGEKGQLVIASLATTYNPYMVVAGATAAFGGWTAVEIVLGNALNGALPMAYLDAATAVLFVVFAGWILYASPASEADEAATAGGTETDGGTPAAHSDAGGTTPTAPAATSGSRSRVPARFQGFLPAFSLMVVGEFGDKTQLVTIGLAAQYGATSAIWVGEMLAIVPVSLATALVIHHGSDRLDRAWFHRIAAAIFLAFALDIAAEYVLGTSVLPI